MSASSTGSESNPAPELSAGTASEPSVPEPSVVDSDDLEPAAVVSTAIESTEPGVTALGDWGRAMDQALDSQTPEAVAPLAQVILARLPRHLPTYERLLRALWSLKHWQEGDEWGRRLLQADPSNPLAWRAVARAAEERHERAQANMIWRRAFEVSPYAADIRAGLARTSIGVRDPLALTPACLGALYMRGYRWQHAAAIHRSLIAADARRIDFQVNLMVALWRLDSTREAYRLARHLARNHPLLIMPWIVVSVLGDETDLALAQNPLATMDPDGEFVRRWLRLDQASPAERALVRLLPGTPVTLTVTENEVNLLPVESPA